MQGLQHHGLSLSGRALAHPHEDLGGQLLDILDRLAQLIGVDDAHWDGDFGEALEAVGVVGVEFVELAEVGVFEGDVAEGGRGGHV